MVRLWQGAGHSRAPSVFSRAAAKLIGEEGEAYDGSAGARESPKEASVRARSIGTPMSQRGSDLAHTVAL